MTLSNAETSPATRVTDVIRKIDYELARFSKLLRTLSTSIDSAGLAVSEADMVALLLRSLPEVVRTFCVHHASGESYQAFRWTALKWEQQQRTFEEFQPKKPLNVLRPSDGNAARFDLTVSDSDGQWNLDAVQDDSRCAVCGSRKHVTAECTTDVTKIKCFRCQKFGHVSANCPDRKKADEGKAGVLKGKGKQKGQGKAKGTGKGFGKKGKLNELECEHDVVDLWYEDDGSWWSDTTWFQTSQVWAEEEIPSHEAWTDPWTDWTWQESWYETETEDQSQAVQSLVLSPLLEDTKGSLSGPVKDLSLQLVQGTMCDQESLVFPCFFKSFEATFHSFCTCDTCSSGATCVRHLKEGRTSCLMCQGNDIPNAAGSDGSAHVAMLKGFPTSIHDAVPEPFLSEQVLCGQEQEECSGLPGLAGVHGLPRDGRELGVREVKGRRAAGAAEWSRAHDMSKEGSVFGTVPSCLSPVFQPLLSEMSMMCDSEFWWLLDSGAAATVMAVSSQESYGAVIQRLQDDRFKAANGSKVDIDGKTCLSVWVEFEGNGRTNWKPTWQKANLKCLVGSISHNILSTTTLCECGWEFRQSSSGCVVRDETSGRQLGTVTYFGGCPWVRLHPAWTEGVGTAELSVSQTMCEVGEGHLFPLSRAAEASLEKHRLQGHTPFDPRCVICARGKATYQHRRRQEGTLETEVQADFGFVTTRGEMVTEDIAGGCLKVLVLTELATGCVGYVHVTHELRKVKTLVCRWLDHFGLASSTSSIVLHTDCERQVGDLVGTSSEKYTFLIRKSGPQQHQSGGGAERAVRRLRESLSVTRADMNQHGADVRLDEHGLQPILTYLGLMHNHFSKVHGSEFSPLEFAVQRTLSKPVPAMFGQTVLAELPTSLRAQSPNETRSIEACYVHPNLDSGGIIVQGALRIEGELVLKRFAARNVRAITPIAWNPELGDQLFVPLMNETQVVPDPARLRARAEVFEPRDDGDAVVEYPDGAPGWLVREMKEPEPNVYPPEHGQAVQLKDIPVFPQPADSGTSSSSASRPSGRPPPFGVIPEETNPARTFPKTPRCPACDTGMNAPGIRHNAWCKKRREAFERGEDPNGVPAKKVRFEGTGVGEVEVPAPAGEGEGIEVTEAGQAAGVESSRVRLSQKREADIDVEELEKSMEEERRQHEPSVLGLFLQDDASCMLQAVSWSLEAGPQKSVATSAELFDPELNSIRFTAGKTHSCVKVKLGGTEVLLWRPDEVIDDTTLMQLNPEQGFEGMREELTNMEHCQTGHVVGQREIDQLVRKNPQARIIPSRWVSAYKSETRVRVRIVAKDLSKGKAQGGKSARELGISSPTPSIEGLHMVLTLAAHRSMRLKALDVSHAFMHSPLPEGLIIILKMPQSVSLTDGTQAYMILNRALNGLRDASLHWLNLLADSIKRVGLTSDIVEPCIYQGVIDGQAALLVAYVDDLLLCSQSEQVERKVMKAIGAKVPLKETGLILPAAEGGGSVTFIGRIISRGVEDDSLTLGVNPHYLDTTFAEFNVQKGSVTVPDVAGILDKALNDKHLQTPLSAEGYARFRKALGKLLWMAQVRHDVKLFLSLIGSQQATPNNGTEAALRALLRFLFNDVGTCLRLPTPHYEDLMTSSARHTILHSFSDASFAPYRFNQRRGITGGVVFCEGGLVRTVARQQQAVSLSSCEAELYAIQTIAQEAVAFSKFCQRVYVGLQELDVREVPKLLLESDSASALQLLSGQDMPKRSRHVEIRVEWLKAKVHGGELSIEHRPGVENVADLFTKCLPTKDYVKHRTTLGFEIDEVPMKDLQSVRDCLSVSGVRVTGQDIAFVEVCCDVDSALKRACRVARIPYLGVVKRMEDSDMFQQVSMFVRAQRETGYRWVHVHVSTPCSSGSPLKNFTATYTETDAIWPTLMKAAKGYLQLGDSKSFELPRYNNIWKRAETKELLQECGVTHTAEVFLCQTGLQTSNGYPVGKCLMFCSPSAGFCNTLTRKFGLCQCRQHGGFSETDWTQTGYYTKELAKGILAGVRSARRCP